MSLQGIRQDWYAFSVTDGDEGVYTSKSFSIEHYQKPAYRITVTPDKDWYYATDPVTFTIEASYYDGTPLSGGELTFSGDYMGSAGPDGPGRTAIRLDEQGRATHTTRLNLAQMRQDRRSALDWSPQSLWYTVDNSGREDGGYFYESGAITVLPSRIAARTERDQGHRRRHGADRVARSLQALPGRHRRRSPAPSTRTSSTGWRGFPPTCPSP